MRLLAVDGHCFCGSRWMSMVMQLHQRLAVRKHWLMWSFRTQRQSSTADNNYTRNFPISGQSAPHRLSGDLWRLIGDVKRTKAAGESFDCRLWSLNHCCLLFVQRKECAQGKRDALNWPDVKCVSAPERRRDVVGRTSHTHTPIYVSSTLLQHSVCKFS